MWLFRLLLRMYPAGFREEYGAVMEQAWADEWREATSTGARARLAVKLAVDLLWQWPEVLAREFGQDARYGLRTWGRRQALTTVAVVTLGMAIGVSAGVFSVMNGILFRSLPFREPERLVQFERYFAPVYKGPEEFAHWTADHDFLGATGVFSIGEYNLNRKPTAVRVKGAETTANFFELLGAKLYLGRGFTREEEGKGKGDVVVLSHGLFEQAFGGDTRVLGQTIVLNGRALTVVGVAWPGFDFPGNATLWTPTVYDPTRIPKSGVTSTITMGRIKDGLSMEQAQAAFRVVEQRHRNDFLNFGPDWPAPLMVELREHLAGDVGKATRVLFAGVCAVLLIACVNLAHLFLSRFGERSQEFEIRAWLGAGAGRITQQIVTECVLFAVLAGMVGLGFAWGVARLGDYFFPPVFAFQQYEVLDGRVLGFTLGVSLLCGLLFGLMPAMLRRRGVRGRNRAQMALLCGQACLTALLVVASIDLGAELVRLNQLDLGYNVRDAYTATISLAGTSYESETGKREFLRKALAAVERTGLVEKMGAIDALPLAVNTFMGATFEVANSKKPELALTASATPGLIEAMGGKILAGRDVSAVDRNGGVPVVLVNESFAKLEGGVERVLGRKLRYNSQDTTKRATPTVVGVYRDFRFESGGTVPAVMHPFEQEALNFFSIVVRPKPGAEDRIASVLKLVLADVDRAVPVYDVMPYGQRLERAMARPNFYGVAVLFFGGFSILLTVLNGYSLCAGALERRKRELGIRAALGATPGQLRWMLVREILPAVVVGVAVGAVLSPYSAVMLTQLLDGLKGAPVWWRAAGVVALALTAAVTIWLKTRGLLAMRPADQLRSQ